MATKISDLRKNIKGLEDKIFLQSLAMAIMADNEAPAHVEKFGKRSSDGAVIMSLYRPCAAHGGIVITITRHETWKYPDVEAHYLDDLRWMTTDSHYGLGYSNPEESNHFLTRVAVERLLVVRHRALHPSSVSA